MSKELHLCTILWTSSNFGNSVCASKASKLLSETSFACKFSKRKFDKVFDLDLNSMCFTYRYANPADMWVPLWHIGLAYKHTLLLLASTYFISIPLKRSSFSKISNPDEAGLLVILKPTIFCCSTSCQWKIVLLHPHCVLLFLNNIHMNNSCGQQQLKGLMLIFSKQWQQSLKNWQNSSFNVPDLQPLWINTWPV